MAKTMNYGTMGGNQWEELLLKQPELATECRWNRLSGDNWVTVLRSHPEWAEHCDWSKLTGQNWAKLLCARPDFENRCDWNKLGVCQRHFPSQTDWVDILLEHPEFISYCDTSILTAYDWCKILEAHPELVDKCDWAKFDDDYCVGVYLSDLIKVRPEIADACDWDVLSGGCIGELLSESPQYSEKCDFSKLASEDWIGDYHAGLLLRRPQFADKRNCWQSFTMRQWLSLLRCCPQFADKFDKWNEVDADDWAANLTAVNGVAVHCPCRMKTGDVVEVLGRSSGKRAMRLDFSCDTVASVDAHLIGRKPVTGMPAATTSTLSHPAKAVVSVASWDVPALSAGLTKEEQPD